MLKNLKNTKSEAHFNLISPILDDSIHKQPLKKFRNHCAIKKDCGQKKHGYSLTTFELDVDTRYLFYNSIGQPRLNLTKQAGQKRWYTPYHSDLPSPQFQFFCFGLKMVSRSPFICWECVANFENYLKDHQQW